MGPGPGPKPARPGWTGGGAGRACGAAWSKPFCYLTPAGSRPAVDKMRLLLLLGFVIPWVAVANAEIGVIFSS